jgi:hypothetical protein
MANTLDKIKISGITYDIIDATAIHSMDGYWTSGQTTDAITAATSALAETIGQEMSGKVDVATYTAYTASTNTTLGNKADTTAVTEAINAATSGKADTTAVTQSITQAVSGYADTAEYDSSTQSIKFYHGGTEVYSVDATDFVKDGFLESVTLENRVISGESTPCLVFEWNTDAGIQETVIPVGGVFDPTNYYTKSEVDTAIDQATSGKADTTAVTQAISEATSGKADTTTVTGINNVLTAHTANTDVHVTTSDKATWSGKQDALVSGTSIKTINGNSVLGSGNIVVQGLPTVTGTTLVFS